MASLVLLEDIANDAIRRERSDRDRHDLLINKRVAFKSLKVPKAVLLDLCAELQPFLECLILRGATRGS